MPTRKNKNEKIYVSYRKNKTNDRCDFCHFSADNDRIVSEHKYFWVVKNIFGYDLWDNQDVLKHFMIVPKKHIESLSLLPDEALREYANILVAYEAKNYSFYARSMSNVSKSVPHQHTHVLKLGGTKKRFFIFLRKPYIFWYK